MLYIGGADNLLSLDYHTIIHMPRMRVKTFYRKSPNFFQEIIPKNLRNSSEKSSSENSPENFFLKITPRKILPGSGYTSDPGHVLSLQHVRGVNSLFVSKALFFERLYH